MDKNTPIDIIIIEPTAIDGKHLPVGHVIKNASAELAMDLAAGGKARPATPELIEQYNPKKIKPADGGKQSSDAGNAGAGAAPGA